MKARPNSRDKILDAAETIVRENAAARLTLDAVSAKAGVSKGGLLYHFNSKDALIRAMLQRIEYTFKKAREKAAANLPPSPGRMLKARILSEGLFQKKKLLGIAAALMVAGARDVKWVKPIKEFREAFFEEVTSSGLDKALVTVIISALEGLWMQEILGLYRISSQEQKAIIQKLLCMVDEEEARLCA